MVALPPDVPQLAAALERIHPRSARVLRTLAATGLDLTAFAATWGLTPAQASVLVARCAAELEGALGAPATGTEEQRAAELARTLPASPGPLWAALASRSAELEAHFLALAEAHDRHPRRRAETILRWVAVVAVVAWWAYNELHR